MDVLRFDALDILPKMTKTPEGYLRGEAPVTRCGVFTYMNPDGTVRKELRHPDDILRSDSLDTIKGLPVVMGHPKVKPPLVNADNAKQLQIGYTGDSYRVDSGFVVQPITITDAAAVLAIESGKRGLSMGYKLACEPETGTYNGDSYTHRQKNVRYNHLAVEDSARAGPDVRMRLDSGDAVQVQQPQQETQEMTPEESARLARLAAMGTVRIDGIEYSGSPELVNAYTKAQAAIGEAQATAAKEKTRADVAEGARDGALAEHKKHKDGEQARIDAAVTARVNLLGDAALVMGDKLDPRLGNRPLMEAVVKASDPKVALDSASDDYVHARFDMAVAEAREKVQAKNRSGNGTGKPASGSTARADSADAPDAGAARARMLANLSSAHQPAAAK